MRRFILLSSLTLAPLLPGVAAQACTTCNSATAQQVRRGIFNGRFLQTVLLTAAPFPFFLGSGLWIYLRLPLPTSPKEEPRTGLPRDPL